MYVMCSKDLMEQHKDPSSLRAFSYSVASDRKSSKCQIRPILFECRMRIMVATCEVCDEPIYDDEGFQRIVDTAPFPKGIHKICPKKELLAGI